MLNLEYELILLDEHDNQIARQIILTSSLPKPNQKINIKGYHLGHERPTHELVRFLNEHSGQYFVKQVECNSQIDLDFSTNSPKLAQKNLLAKVYLKPLSTTPH